MPVRNRIALIISEHVGRSHVGSWDLELADKVIEDMERMGESCSCGGNIFAVVDEHNKSCFYCGKMAEGG